MKRPLLWGLLALSLAMNFSFGGVYLLRSHLAGAGQNPSSGMAGCPIDEIKLTQAQQEQLARIRSDMPTLRRDYAQTMAELRAELGEAVAAEHPDRAAIGALLDRYTVAQHGLQQHAVEHLLRVRDLLDDGQRAQFRQLMRTRIFQGLRAAEAGQGD